MKLTKKQKLVFNSLKVDFKELLQDLADGFYQNAGEYVKDWDRIWHKARKYRLGIKSALYYVKLEKKILKINKN